MRVRKTNKDISAHAIAGSQVILLGIDATAKAAKGLLGFTIYKRKGNGKEAALGAGKIFEGVHKESRRGKARSDEAPIQGFMWSDYVVTPNTSYTYRVVPVYGKPGALKPGKGVSVTVRSEDPSAGKHAIYFNRGVAGSQAYARQFGDYRRWYKVDEEKDRWQQFIKPEDVPEGRAYKWLSRGLEEAMLDFIGEARGPEYSIRAALYELTHMPAIQAFVEALESGADVKVVHHSKNSSTLRLKRRSGAAVNVTYPDGEEDPVQFKNKEVVTQTTKDSVGRDAEEAIARAALKNPVYRRKFNEMFIDRTKATISHNKFVVLLKNGKPVEVWTGSTNMTPGGIYGQSNVGHRIRDAEVAQKYLNYWEKLATDPKKTSTSKEPQDTGLRNWTVLQQPDLSGPPPENSITPVFSPRLSAAMLEWYSQRLASAKSSVHFTTAFTVAEQIFDKVTKTKKVADGNPYLRYLLLEGVGGLMRKRVGPMKKVKQNRLAWGEVMKGRKGAGSDELIETLTGLNDNVNFLHTKYMLIDPLTDDPIVISGSANFSDASTRSNDENMLIIRGNKRLADIMLGEFMRLFNHWAARNRGNARSDEEAARSHYLVPDDSWTKPYYKKGEQEYEERRLFS